MDFNKNKKPAAASAAAAGEVWTEERHARFLNRMEGSFVRTLMLAGGRGGAATSPAARLDRYVPDSATESTRDAKLGVGRAASLASQGDQNLSFRNHNMTKKRLYPQREYNPLQDQVVPDSSIAPKHKKGGKQVAH